MIFRTILVGFMILVVVVSIALMWQTQNQATKEATWEQFNSKRMRISFEYPKGWEVLSETTRNADVLLCPPVKERITTRYRNANCITFLFGERLRMPMNEMEGENAVYSRFSREVESNWDQLVAEYKLLTHNRLDDTVVNFIGLYRNGPFDIVGMWQAVCEDGKQLECKAVFQRVLASLQFTDVTSP